MQKYYHSLIVKPSSHYALFGDFLSDTLPIGFEETEEGFIVRSEDELETIAWGVEQFAQALQAVLGGNIEVELKLEMNKNDDWIMLYQQGISPVDIPPFYVHPTWNAPKEGATNIMLDPALAFGTGHHPTTATCLKAVARCVKPGSDVLDVGCGSGILGIAALKMGANVDACDTDSVCVENTHVNAKQNGVAFGTLWEGSVSQRLKNYDVVIANIVADVLIMIASDLKKATKPGGLLILSGIMDKYEAKVLRAFKDFEPVERIPQDEWVTLVVKNN